MKRALTKAERNRTFDIIKLIKTTYTDNIFISNIMGSTSMVASMNVMKINKIFANSYYTGISERIIPELVQSIVSVEILYDAFKAKAESIEVCDNNHIRIYSESGEEFFVGEHLDEHENNMYYGNILSGFDDVYNILDVYGDHINADSDWKYDSKMCTSDELVRLVNYETITVRSDNEQDVGLIITAKCFPNIKKCEGIKIDWLYNNKQEMFTALVASQFMSCDVFKPIVFHMMVKALRC